MWFPFPGIDPFIESQEWEDFHTRLNTVISDLLSPSLEPKYVVRVERRVYVEHVIDDQLLSRRTDVAVLAAGSRERSDPPGSSTATAPVGSPVECLLPMPEEHREAYLVIRDREALEVVTVLETLSPANKRPHSDGQEQYLRKRDEVLQSRSHLIELDLLRGGHRLPTIGALPVADYYAIVSRVERRPRAEVYSWTLRKPAPSIPIPLQKGDSDVVLELQQAIRIVYERARYALSIDYQAPLIPALSPDDAEWSQGLLVQQPGS